jgi:hypothetical protein
MGVAAAAPAPPARAAPRSPAALAAARETAKVTLPETSIAGPGLAAPTAIAWTGTDAAHHLNIRTGIDGLHFPTKTTLPETSPDGPGLAKLPIEGPPIPYVLAWRGSDANHSLNVETFPNRRKLTLRENSFAAPALTILNSPIGVLLAWTGTDANHSLNVLPITVSDSGALVPGTKTVLSQFSSDAGPGVGSIIMLVGAAFQFVLGWSTRATQQLNLAESTDGVHFTSVLGSGLPQTSATAPQFVQAGGTSVRFPPCIAWTGTDAAQHLNVQCTTQFPQWPDPAHTKTVLPETALGAPGFFQGEIAWTGTDAAHHLNVAQLENV